MSNLLRPTDVSSFRTNGYLVIPGFYDVATEIEPIQRGIHELIGLVARRHGVELGPRRFTRSGFDQGFMDLITVDRTYGGEVYDAVKQIPAFQRLIANPRHEALFVDLRPDSMPAIATGGSGIRIDIPGEDHFRADWHQDYLGQFRSLDGLVLWSPLVTVTEELGPVAFARGSHADGLRPVVAHDPDRPDATGAYALVLAGRDDAIAGYPHDAPLSRPGDLVAIDYQTLHASGHNRSSRPRWSMQMRYFNFRDATGLRIGWRGSFAAGVQIGDVHPELVAG